jgi:cation transport protein ChaC
MVRAGSAAGPGARGAGAPVDTPAGEAGGRALRCESDAGFSCWVGSCMVVSIAGAPWRLQRPRALVGGGRGCQAPDALRQGGRARPEEIGRLGRAEELHHAGGLRKAAVGARLPLEGGASARHPGRLGRGRLGDRSENADYIYGKKRLREIDRRIRFLTKRMDELEVVDLGPRARADRVYFGAWVELEDEDGERVRYQIVGADEFDAAKGRISVESPVGARADGQTDGGRGRGPPAEGRGDLHADRHRLSRCGVRGGVSVGSDPAGEPSLWIFGYGSLVWRPAFPHRAACRAWIEGHVRRFWQGSTDHRGRPGRPGRVVTIVPEADPAIVRERGTPGRTREASRCWGTAYQVTAAEAESILAGLDHRERGGVPPARARDHPRRSAGRRGGPERGGPRARLRRGPRQRRIPRSGPPRRDRSAGRTAEGPSGANAEYLFELAAALRRMQVADDHVFALESAVRAVLARPDEPA